MHSRRLSQLLLVLLTVANLAVAQQPAKRLLKLDDLARVREVRDPQLSPDGQWVAYVLSGIDVKEDKSNAHIWMVGFDGKNDRQITFSQDSENVAALESGRKIPLLHIVATRQDTGQSGLAARPKRRRGYAADRIEGPPTGLRMVAGFQATGAGGRRS